MFLIVLDVKASVYLETRKGFEIGKMEGYPI